MSAANSAAKKRRAEMNRQMPPPQVVPPPGIPATAPIARQGAYPPQPGGGLTLQQALLIIDKRLTDLEKKIESIPAVNSASAAMATTITTQEYLDESNRRFEMLVEEIVNMKNSMITLQTFTMEVNKTLLENVLLQKPLVVGDVANSTVANDGMRNVRGKIGVAETFPSPDVEIPPNLQSSDL